MLKQLISVGAKHIMLDEILQAKLKYSAGLLSAIQQLQGEAFGEEWELLLMALIERQEQVNHLILICLEPTLSDASLMVVRAGLKTKDERQIANAVEALESMDDEPAIRRIAALIKGDHQALRNDVDVQKFVQMEDVLNWCDETGDWWLRECCMNIRHKAEKVGANA